MKKLFVIFILSQFSLFSQINEDEFYNTTDFYLQVHKIDKGEFLFFGNKGGIIRTYDSGDNYVQNYSGTTSNILNLENHKDYIVGITDNYEFMASQDKGSHWIVRKLTDSIVSMDASDSFVVLASLFEEILISSNVGKSWDRIKVGGKYFRYIFIIDDRIYTIDKNNSIDYTDDFGKTWNNIKTPTELFDGQFVAKRVGNIISLRNKGAFFRLENDQTISKFEFQTGSINTHTTIGENFDFATANSNTREINYYKYNTETKSEELIYSYYNVYFYGNTFRIYDLELDDNVVFMTLENRTIMRSINYGKTWEVVTHTPILDSGWPLKVFDEDNWSLIGNSIIYKSTDGGVTYKPGKEYLIDTSDGKIGSASIRDYHYFNKDSAVFFTSKYISNLKIDAIYTTNDGGNTLRSLGTGLPNNASFVADMNEYLIISIEKLGRLRVFYNLSEEEGLDSINVIDSVQGNYVQTFSSGNKIYLFYSKITDDNDKTTSTLAVSSDSLKTIKDIFSIKNDSLNSLRWSFLSYNGNIYFANSAIVPTGFYFTNSYYRLDTSTDEINKVEIPFTIISGHQNDVPIEEQQYFRATEFILKDTSYKYKYVEVKVEGTKFVYDTIGENKNGLIPLKIFDTDNVILTGNQYSIWKQIEPDRLTSVEQIESRTENLPIYPFAPSPNPAKEKIKVKFYTESMEKIDKLKVHLVNITTGIKEEIKDYDISFTNNWNGEIAIDISDFSIGSYLINLSIDDYNRSSKLIITK